MTKLRMKTNFIMVMVISLLLVGSIGSITKNIELSEKDMDDLQEQSLETLQDSGNNPVREEIRAKVEEITSYEEHDLIVINGNTNFNDTAYAEGWPGNGSIDNPFIIQGLNITGPSGSSSIYIQSTNVYFQINNCLLAVGIYGLFLSGVSNGLISNNTIVSNTYGMWLESSSNNTFFNNSFSGNMYGIHLLYSSENNTLSNNSFYGSWRRLGAAFQWSGNNRIVNNSFFDCGLYFWGSQISEYSQTEVANNSVNGRPLIFWQNINGGTVSSGAGQIILINCRSITITGQNLSVTSVGLQVAFSSNLTVSDNNASDNGYGILLHHSTGNFLFNNIANHNSLGIELLTSENNDLSNNTLAHNFRGIFVRDSSNNNAFLDNFVTNSEYGITIREYSDANTLSGNTISSSYDSGISVYSYSTNNVIYGNTISNNGNHGIYLSSYSTNNDIYDNTISNNGNYGIYLSDSENNMILRNDFRNNNPGGSSQGYDGSNLGLTDTFAYNYWSDWTTPDTNSDGIVDSPYAIDGDSNNQDSHPLINPAHLSPNTVIFPNGGITLDGIVTIQWSSAIDRWSHMVTYTVYYSNDSGSTWFSLASGLDTNSYQWDTTTVPDGTDYLVKVVATCSAGVSVEDISDSTFVIQNAVVTTPSTPHSLTATSGELFVYLTWAAPSSDGGSAITGYQVYRGTSSGEYTVFLISSDTNYNDTLVNGGVTYYYVVIALNAIGESVFSTEVSATPTEPTVIQPVVPSAPQSLTATAGELFVYLTWMTPSSDGGSAITGYHVYRGTNSGVYTLIFIASDTNYNDTLVNGDFTYYYVVTAINAVGESENSSEVSATPTEPTVVQFVTPSAPQSLTATAGELFVYLTWTAPSSDGSSAITGYHVYRGTSSGEYTVTFATLSTNYNDTLVVGVTYYYVVTALNAIGESVFSTEVSATPTEPTVIQLVAPSAPQSLTATAGELFVSLSWTAPSNDGGSAITGYQIYRGISSSQYSLIFITSDTSFNDTLVTGETTYYYVVTAINSVGESIPSNEVTGTPFLPTSQTTTTSPSSTTTTSAMSESISDSTTTQAEPGSFPDLFAVLLFLGTVVFFTRKKNRS